MLRDFLGKLGYFRTKVFAGEGEARFWEMDEAGTQRCRRPLLRVSVQGAGYEEACGRVEFMGPVGLCSKSDCFFQSC